MSNPTLSALVTPAPTDQIVGPLTTLPSVIGNINTAIKSGRVYNVVDYGAKGDSSTDDTAAFQTAITDINAAGGGVLFVPRNAVAGNYYKITTALFVLSNVWIVGEGYGSFIKNVTNTNTASACVFCLGNYAGFGSAGSFFAETTYYIADTVNQGQNTVTMKTAGQESNFSVGQIVALRDQFFPGGGSYNSHSMLNKVIAIDTTNHILTLRYGIRDLYTTPASTTNYPIICGEGSAGIGAASAFNTARAPYICQRAALIGLRIEQAGQQYYQVIHNSAWECVFQDLWLWGGAMIGGNPIAYCVEERVTAQYGRTAAEYAYCSNDNILRGCRFTRTYTLSDTASGWDVVFHETGGHNVCEDVWVTTYPFTGNNYSAFSNHQHGTKFVRCRANQSQGVGMSSDQFYEGVDFVGCEVYGSNTDGIQVNGFNSRITGCTVIGTPGGHYGIRLGASSANCYAGENMVGGHQSLSGADVVRDDNLNSNGASTNIVARNMSKVSVPDYSAVASATTAAGTTTLFNVALTSGQMHSHVRIRMEASGQMIGTNGTKTIIAQLTGSVAHTLATVTMAAATTGEWKLRVYVANNGTTTGQVYTWETWINGVYSSGRGTLTENTATTTPAFALQIQGLTLGDEIDVDWYEMSADGTDQATHS